MFRFQLTVCVLKFHPF